MLKIKEQSLNKYNEIRPLVLLQMFIAYCMSKIYFSVHLCKLFKRVAKLKTFMIGFFLRREDDIINANHLFSL